MTICVRFRGSSSSVRQYRAKSLLVASRIASFVLRPFLNLDGQPLVGLELFSMTRRFVCEWKRLADHCSQGDSVEKVYVRIIGIYEARYGFPCMHARRLVRS